MFTAVRIKAINVKFVSVSDHDSGINCHHCRFPLAKLMDTLQLVCAYCQAHIYISAPPVLLTSARHGCRRRHYALQLASDRKKRE